MRALPGPFKNIKVMLEVRGMEECVVSACTRVRNAIETKTGKELTAADLSRVFILRRT